jgi:hypothetical protein
MRCARTFVVGTLCLVVLGLGAGSAGADTRAGVERPRRSTPDEATLAAPTNGAGGSPKPQKPQLVTGSGDITDAIAEYQALLGADNGGVPQTFSSGRREINWDAVPDEHSQPNSYPPDFFNAPDAPRARGAVLSTPGDHLGVSADSDNPSGAAVRFGDINPKYTGTFRTNSEERLFSPVGSNVANIKFYLPGTTTAALTRGFGAVYTDVDSKEAAAFTFYDAKDRKLGTYPVPKSKDGLSFLGVAFKKPIVSRVKIVYGTSKLGPDDSKKYDVAVMDDFIYGEPQAPLLSKKSG